MICFPNCKINLGLYITECRPDGYHNLETVFYPLPLKDVLEIVPAAASAMHTTGLAVAGNATDNLVWKAWQLLQNAYPDQVGSFDMYLHKIIPMGAGMGGGSADGAFMLRLINDTCNLQLSQETLAAYALQLGSDCPFFIYNTPSFALGRGEQLSPVAIDLSAYTIQLICPAVHVSTAAAFGMIQPAPARFDLRQLSQLPVPAWKDHVHNDFEAPVFSAHPVLASIKQQLYEQGAVYASMSGSGSTLFGIFENGRKATIQAAGTAFQQYVLNTD